MRSTMQEFQLTIGALLRHVTSVHPDGQVITATADGSRSETYAELGRRAARLANALRSLGITGDQRVGTFQWNNAEHLEAYLAIPSMGAVLHTLNIRLFPEQLVYVANHAEDKVVIVDDSLVDLLAKQLPQLETVEHVVVAGPEAKAANLDSLRAAGKEVHLYEDLLAEQPETFDWPDLDENDASAMCYTSGTTGNPKGVVYSHRTSYLHSMGVALGICSGITWHDRLLPIVPMFHANAWGLPYAALMTGASLVCRTAGCRPSRCAGSCRRSGRPCRVRCPRSGTTCWATWTTTPTSTCPRTCGWCSAAARRCRCRCRRRSRSGTASSSSRPGG